MLCPRCKAKTEIKNEAEGPWFCVKTRICTTIGCPLHTGFHTVEAVTGHEVFRGVIDMAEREALAAQLAKRDSGERERAQIENAEGKVQRGAVVGASSPPSDVE